MIYLLSLKLQMQRSFVLRWNVFWTLIFTMLWLLLYKLLWSSIFSNRAEIAGISLEYLLGYYLMVRIIGTFTGNRVDRELSRGIMNGTFVGDLLRPVNVLWHKTGDRFGLNLVNTLLVSLPTVTLAVFVLSFPVHLNMTTMLYFIFSLILSFLINININILAGLTAFWIRGVEGVTHAKDFIVQIASGALIPLAFLPESVQKIFIFMPFRYITDIPIKIYIHGLSEVRGNEIIVGIAWCMLLLVINQLIFEKGVKRLTVYGG